MTTYSIVNGLVGPELSPSAPVRSALPDAPRKGARKAELVEWIEGVTGSALDGTNLTVPVLRALVDELVDAVERGDGVGSVSFGDDGVADGVELGDGEAAGALDADPDAGHED